MGLNFHKDLINEKIVSALFLEFLELAVYLIDFLALEGVFLLFFPHVVVLLDLLLLLLFLGLLVEDLEEAADLLHVMLHLLDVLLGRLGFVRHIF